MTSTPGPPSSGGGVGETQQQATRHRTGTTPAKAPSSNSNSKSLPLYPDASSGSSVGPPKGTSGGGDGPDHEEDDYDDKSKKRRSRKNQPPPFPLSLAVNRASNACRSCLASGNLKKKVVSTIMGLVALGLLADFLFSPPDQRLITSKEIKGFLLWVQGHPVKGTLAYVVVYATMVVLLLPGTPLTIGSGYIYKMAYGWTTGMVIGSVFSTLGSLLGSVICFCLGRYLMKDTVRQWVRKSKFFGAIDDAVGKNGFKIMSLLYLSPILPLGPVSYMCGTTSMKLGHFAMAKVACVPLMIFYVFLGASAGALVHKGGAATTDANAAATEKVEDTTAELDHLVEGESTGMILFAILLSAASMALISHFVKKELMKVLKEQKDESEVNDLAVLLGSDDHPHHQVQTTGSGSIEMSAADKRKKAGRQRRQLNTGSNGQHHGDNTADHTISVEVGKDV